MITDSPGRPLRTYTALPIRRGPNFEPSLESGVRMSSDNPGPDLPALKAEGDRRKGRTKAVLRAPVPRLVHAHAHMYVSVQQLVDRQRAVLYWCWLFVRTVR